MMDKGVRSQLLIAIIGISIVVMMIIPVPPQFLDFLLALNISFSLIIFLVAIYIKRPLEFSVFPSVLLFATLYRLALNVSSTRLILNSAYAGKVIDAFGNFVVGGNYVVGILIFLVIVVIQFLVITKGATRIAEVAARFTLDALPGKQMSIDADLNAGLITEEEARKRRKEIARESDFYGAMDGASKFVRGDAIAGLVIMVIDILGGLIIGMAQKGMPAGEALTTYTLLTVGDGLVSQLPALIISSAAGIIVTRATGESDLGAEFFGQLSLKSKPLFIVSGFLFAFAMIPALPKVPFILVSLMFGFLGYRAMQEEKLAVAEGPEIEEVPEETVEEKVEDLLRVDILEIEIGFGLIPLVDETSGSDILHRINAIRRQFVLDLGLVVPPIRIRDNINLKQNQYIILIKGQEVARGELMPNRYLAMNPGTATEEIEGVKTIEPTFGLPAIWIAPSKKTEAEMKGYTVVEPTAVLATHLSEIIKKHASTILTRQDVKDMVDRLKEFAPAVVEDTIGKTVSLGLLHRILRRLLDEGVSIRDMITILETMGDYAPQVKDIITLTEMVREALKDQIVGKYQDDSGILHVIKIDAHLEGTLVQMINPESGELEMPVDMLHKFYNEVNRVLEKVYREGYSPVIVCSSELRYALFSFLRQLTTDVAVISYREASAARNIVTVDTIKVER